MFIKSWRLTLKLDSDHTCGSVRALPELTKYVTRFVEATSGQEGDADKTFSMSLAEAAAHRSTFKALSEEIGIVAKALSLPLLEPLTSQRYT